MFIQTVCVLPVCSVAWSVQRERKLCRLGSVFAGSPSTKHMHIKFMGVWSRGKGAPHDRIHTPSLPQSPSLPPSSHTALYTPSRHYTRRVVAGRVPPKGAVPSEALPSELCSFPGDPQNCFTEVLFLSAPDILPYSSYHLLDRRPSCIIPKPFTPPLRLLPSRPS